MPTATRFVSLTVTPGVPCKVILPPCSALQLSNAALAAQPGPSFGRCQLECDLATHSFVVCTLLTTGTRQAGLDVAITNDPDETAWFFLNAKGPHAFHVVGRLVEDRVRRANTASVATNRLRPTALPAKTAVNSAAGSSLSTNAAKRRVGGTGASGDALRGSEDSASDMIEVLLPGNDEGLGFDAPSDADSEDFIEFMQSSSAGQKSMAKGGVNGGVKLREIKANTKGSYRSNDGRRDRH